MADPNPRTPEDPARTAPRNPPSSPTGEWAPGCDPGVQLAVPQRIGQFEVEAVLGTGTYGRVFLAFDPKTGRQVAIKQPFGEGLKPEYRDDFLKEARAAAAIDQHANVCPVYHVDTDAGLPYIVMRFVAGGTLKDFLDRHRRRGPLPVRTALQFATQIAKGLAAAHAKGIIHRDLKPANVLIDDANKQVLITDFGLARISSRAEAAASLQRGAHGTALYMPPEQWGSQAFGPITPLADVYSLGVILYEMLAGDVPFTGTTYELMTRHCTEAPRPPSGKRRGLDPRLDALCLKALEKMPGNRYRSARAFEEALSEYLDGDDIELVEIIETGEPLEGPASPARGTGEVPVPWGQPLPDPARPARKPGAPPGSTASLQGETIDEKEVVRCPKCAARLEIVKGRAKPVECPMCELKFAVEAGRQAAARASRTAERQKLPTAEPVRARREPNRRRDDRGDSEDNRIRPRDWRPAARGLRLGWIGMLLALIFLTGVGLTFIASLGDEARAGGASGPSAGKVATSRGSEHSDSTSARDGSDRAVFGFAYAFTGLGFAAGLALVGLGRLIAARVPGAVGGGTWATLGALAAWLAALSAAVLFVLIAVLQADTGERPDRVLVGVAGVAAGAITLLLLAGEFAFSGYLAAVGDHVRRGFPHGVATAAKVCLWIFLACLLFGGASGAAAAAFDESRQKSATTFLTVVAGGAGCIAFLVVPFWGFLTLWLNVQAAVAVGRCARDEG